MLKVFTQDASSETGGVNTSIVLRTFEPYPMELVHCFFFLSNAYKNYRRDKPLRVVRFNEEFANGPRVASLDRIRCDTPFLFIFGGKKNVQLATKKARVALKCPIQ